MSFARFHPLIADCCAILAAACYSQAAVAGTLCVNPAGSHGCYSTIQAAVNHSSANSPARFFRSAVLTWLEFTLLTSDRRALRDS